MAVVFLDREAAAGDPSAWSRACASLEAVRAAVRPRDARIVVAVVQASAFALMATVMRDWLCCVATEHTRVLAAHKGHPHTGKEFLMT